MKPQSLASKRPDGLWQYFLLTFALSWAAWGSLIVFRIPGGSVNPDAPPPPPLGLLLLGLGILSPSIASVIMTWRTGGRAGLRALWQSLTRFNLGWGPYAVIVVVPLLTSLIRVAVHLLRGGALLASPLVAQPALLIPFTAQIFVFGPLMEEPGWRGFALDRLLRRWGFVPASLVLGGLHALWHLPSFFVQGTIQQAWGNLLVEFAVLAAVVMGGSFTFTWVHVASGGSIWAAILLHTANNFGISFLWLLYDGGTADRLVLALTTAVLAALLVGLARPGRAPAPGGGQPRLRGALSEGKLR
jgi:membrane protease YdiL (CAAX protease family)